MAIPERLRSSTASAGSEPERRVLETTKRGSDLRSLEDVRIDSSSDRRRSLRLLLLESRRKRSKALFDIGSVNMPFDDHPGKSNAHDSIYRIKGIALMTAKQDASLGFAAVYGSESDQAEVPPDSKPSAKTEPAFESGIRSNAGSHPGF